MRQRSIASVVVFMTLSLCASHTAAAQQEPLTRTFVAGTEERYQVTVAIRVETHGISTEKIGDKTYADAFTHEAKGQVNWRSTRKISAVNADGAASLVEKLDRFQPTCDGDRAAHRIENFSPDRTKPEGEESMEWLEASGDIPAATLHVSQNLTWIDSGGKNLAKTAGTRPDPRQLFYADSLNTISLLDGSLLKASRSATHEKRATLGPVPGLPDAPIFSSRLTVTVTIFRLP
jgi:hypothetical protein